MSITIEDYTQTLLVQSGLIDPGKILKPGDWQNVARPYIIHMPVGPSPDYAYEANAPVPLIEWSYQVSIRDDTFTKTATLARAVIAFLNGSHGTVDYTWTGWTATYEAEVKVHHVALDFSVWEALNMDT